MVSINDHPAIREAFNGLHMEGLDAVVLNRFTSCEHETKLP
jgi:hypothetical protein